MTRSAGLQPALWAGNASKSEACKDGIKCLLPTPEPECARRRAAGNISGALRVEIHSTQNSEEPQKPVTDRRSYPVDLWRRLLGGDGLRQRYEPPPGSRTRKKFIRLDTGKASRRRIKSNSARSLSARNAASAASRFG